MILFAIRHKPTGLYLPRIQSRGSTHHEPTAPLKQARLFHRERDARGFLTVWLQGKQTQYQTYEGDYDIEIHLTPVPTRKREEMEVVAFKLTEEAR